MQIRQIIKDSLKYPFSDWKKLLILGVIINICFLSSTVGTFGVTNIDIIWLLTGIGLIIGFIVNGYLFRIIKLSLDKKFELPELKNWIDMGAEGVKVFITGIFYLLPAILITVTLQALFYDPYITLAYQSIGLDPSDFLINGLTSIIILGIFNLIGILFTLSEFVADGILAIFIGMLYVVAIIPIISIAIANIAHYEGELRAAFRFGEIIEDIQDIGLKNLIKWYLATGITFLIIYIIYNLILYISSLNSTVGTITGLILPIIFLPYIFIYLAKSFALMYTSDI